MGDGIFGELETQSFKLSEGPISTEFNTHQR
jgi:hypothetical protein